MTDTTQEGLSEDELAVLQESSAQRSDESATDWAARARQEADAARAKAQDRSNEATAEPVATEGVEGVTPDAPQDDAPASPEVQEGTE